MNKLPNSWHFANALVLEYIDKNKVKDTPQEVYVRNRLHNDFEYGILPNRQRYELDARL